METAEQYHSKRGEYFTSHMLIGLHQGKSLDEVMAKDDKDAPALAFGRAAHVLVLEGLDAFNDQYHCGGPTNPKTGKLYGAGTKTFAAWAAKVDGKIALHGDDADKIAKMANRLKRIKAFQQLTENGTPEVTIRRDYLGIPCQSRIDWISGRPAIVDLKTTADLFGFQYDITNYGYLWQMAFYQEMARRWFGCTLDVYLVAIDKQDEPNGYVMRLSESSLATAQAENESMMWKVKEEFLQKQEELLCRQSQKQLVKSWPI